MPSICFITGCWSPSGLAWKTSHVTRSSNTLNCAHFNWIGKTAFGLFALVILCNTRVWRIALRFHPTRTSPSCWRNNAWMASLSRPFQLEWHLPRRLAQMCPVENRYCSSIWNLVNQFYSCFGLPGTLKVVEYLDNNFGGLLEIALLVHQFHSEVLSPDEDDEEKAQAEHHGRNSDDAFQKMRSISFNSQFILLIHVELHRQRFTQPHSLWRRALRENGSLKSIECFHNAIRYWSYNIVDFPSPRLIRLASLSFMKRMPTSQKCRYQRNQSRDPYISLHYSAQLCVLFIPMWCSDSPW